jgi:hypothetical protein
LTAHASPTARPGRAGVLVAALVAAPLLAGCATLFSGTTDPLTFDANVPGVRLTVDGQYLGELPLALTMSRNFVGGQQFLARFERDGYVTQEFRLQREFNTVAILDISSPVTCGGIDLLSGALMRFSPTAYHVQMLPAGERASSEEFQRGARAWGLALASWRNVQKDLARGGGEHLDALASALGGGDEGAARSVTRASLSGRWALLTAAGPHELVARLDAVLAADATTARYRP